VIGAGPAGLTARWSSRKPSVSAGARSGLASGGISQTVERDGWRFDIAGTDSSPSLARPGILGGGARPTVPGAAASEPHLLRREVLLLPDQAARRADKARTYRGSALCGVLRLRSPASSADQADWSPGCRSFRVRLYRMFFKTYTEKVWGVRRAPYGQTGCTAHQELVAPSAVLHAITRAGHDKAHEPDRAFQYPRLARE